MIRILIDTLMLSLLQLQRVLQNIQQADKALAASLSNNTQNSMPNPVQVPQHQPNAYSAHTERRSSIAKVVALPMTTLSLVVIQH